MLKKVIPILLLTFLLIPITSAFALVEGSDTQTTEPSWVANLGEPYKTFYDKYYGKDSGYFALTNHYYGSESWVLPIKTWLDQSVTKATEQGYRYVIITTLPNLKNELAVNHDLSNIKDVSLYNSVDLKNTYFFTDSPGMTLQAQEVNDPNGKKYFTTFIKMTTGHFKYAYDSTVYDNSVSINLASGTTSQTDHFYNFTLNQDWFNTTEQKWDAEPFLHKMYRWGIYDTQDKKFTYISTEETNLETGNIISDINDENFWKYETCDAVNLFCHIRNAFRWSVKIIVPIDYFQPYDKNNFETDLVKNPQPDNFTFDILLIKHYVILKLGDLATLFDEFDNRLEVIKNSQGDTTKAITADFKGVLGLHQVTIIDLSWFDKNRETIFRWERMALWFIFFFYMVHQISSLFRAGTMDMTAEKKDKIGFL